jgi:hypothetical protein
MISDTLTNLTFLWQCCLTYSLTDSVQEPLPVTEFGVCQTSGVPEIIPYFIFKLKFSNLVSNILKTSITFFRENCISLLHVSGITISGLSEGGEP